MKIIKIILDASEKFLTVACVLSFATMFVLGVMTVFFRFVIESSLTFPDELIRYLFVWIIALGSAIGIRRNIHAAIGLIVNALPSSIARLVLLSSSLFTMAFFWILIKKGYSATMLSSEQVSPMLEVSMAYVYSAVPVGAAFGLAYTIELFLNQLLAPASDLVAEDH